MKKQNSYRLLRLLLILLIAALVCVVGYILYREYQYSVGDAYYDSLRNTGWMKGWWTA
ncbi:MAG: hypothetical protein IJB81_01895 [Clostridia bacterium]|nr:hypothetical protein [Clostridia bacterium]